MPEYLSPAVYIEEQDSIQPIEGVSTSTAGFVGMTQRGPVALPPDIPGTTAVLVTSMPEFERTFGSYFDFGPSFLGLNSLPHAVNGFFVNGGQRLYVVRVTGSGAKQSTVTTKGGLVTRLVADTSAAAPTKAKLSTLRLIDNGTQLLFTQVKQGLTTISGPHTVASYDRTNNEVTLGTNLSG